MATNGTAQPRPTVRPPARRPARAAWSGLGVQPVPSGGVPQYADDTSASVLTGGTSAPGSGTLEVWTVTVTAGTFPAASMGSTPVRYFTVADPQNPSELTRVVTTTGGTWTVVRGAGGTTPVQHAPGFSVQLVIGAGGLSTMLQSANNLGDVANPAAALASLGGLPLAGGAVTGALSVGGAFTANDGATVNGPLDVNGDATLSNGYAAQYAGAGFVMYNAIASMGNQGGAYWYAQINNAGVTQGALVLNQVSYTGAYVETLAQVDLNAQQWQFMIPAVHNAGTNTSGTAAATAPAFVSGTAQQLSANQDVMLYIAVQTSAALAVAIGPTAGVATTLMPSKAYALGLASVRIPAGWYVMITGTIADLAITAVTC